MNKLKKLWNENRIMLVLGIIVFLCFLVIAYIMFQYFFGVTTSNYGDRLESIQEVVYDEMAKSSLESSYQDEHLVDFSVDVRGKIIYVRVKYDATVALSDAQKKSVEAYQTIDEKYRNLYHYNVTISQDATEASTGYCLMGAKNVSSASFVWSNNTPVTTEE